MSHKDGGPDVTNQEDMATRKSSRNGPLRRPLDDQGQRCILPVRVNVCQNHENITSRWSVSSAGHPLNSKWFK